MANETEKLRHLAAIIRAEVEIESATKKAFKAWLPLVRDAILHGKAPGVQDSRRGDLLLAAVVVNPDDAEQTREAWAAAVAAILLTIGKVFDRQYVGAGATRRALAIARERYLATARAHLLAIPDEVFAELRLVVDRAILDGLDDAGLARRVRDALSPLREVYVKRAEAIARTEAISAYNAGRHEAYLELARETGQSWTKTWLSVRDTRVRHTHAEADGQKVVLTAKFNVGGFVADYPGDPRLPAQEAVNCRCVAIYAGTRGNGASMTTPIVSSFLWGTGSFDPENPLGVRELVASIDQAYAADGRLPNGWRGRMAPIGIPTGDGRQLDIPEGGLRTRELPITFNWAPTNEGGHQGSTMVARIDYAWAEEFDGQLYLMGEGAIDVAGYNGAEYARQLADGFAMFVSIDPDEVTFTTKFYNAEGAEVPFNEAVMVGDGQETLKDGYHVLDVMTDWRLAGVTGVTIPAFQEARIEPVYDYQPRSAVKQATADKLLPQGELLDMLDAYDGDDEGDLAELARALRKRRAYDVLTDGERADEIVAAVTGSTSYPVYPNRKQKWDGHGARQRVAKWASSDGSGDPAKINKKRFQSAFMWMGDPNSGNALDGESFADSKPKAATPTWNVEDAKGGFVDIIDGKPYIVANAVIALAGGHGIQAMDVPGAAKKAMLGKLKTLYGKMRKSFPDFPDFPFSAEKAAEAELVAGAAGQVFRLESFEDPKLTGPTPLTVKDGRVYGHVALFESCYMAQGGARSCIKPPKNGDYSRFLTHGARLESGDVLPVGMITFGEGHFAGGSLKASMANYANLATGAAKVNVGEDAWGVWVAGEVLAAFADKADDLLLSPLSGHWEPDLDRGGALTLIAAHVVVTPGFHVPRLVATMGADGTVESALIAGPFTFLEKSAELFDAAVEAGEVVEVATREDGVVLYEDLVAAVQADRRAQRALTKLGLDADSRAARALTRLGVRE